MDSGGSINGVGRNTEQIEGLILIQDMEIWAGRSKFQYKAAVPDDVILHFGKGQRQRITARLWTALCAHFSGKTVKVGTSPDNPPAC